MKNKIGIVTITEGCNYGNRLQNWALQVVINELGYSAETLFHYTRNVRWYLAQCKNFVKQMFFFLLNRENSLAHYKRIFIFRNFNREYINSSKLKIVDNKVTGESLDNFCKFIVGSDQVWNTDLDIIPPNLESYFLRFAPIKKRTAYAASFGTSVVNATYYSRIKLYLQEFDKISVRESEGAKIVDNMMGIHVPVVLDPTLLIDKVQWMKFSKKPGFIKNKKYVVTYFLDATEYSRKIIKKIEEEFIGFDIFNLRSEFNKCQSQKELYEYLVNPNEFVWLIANSQLVYTDSFHATVFSIIFRKPFVVYKRCSSEGKGMEGRIVSLLNMFSLTNKIGDFDGKLIVPDDFDAINIDEIMECERQKSFEYLKKALEV